MLSLTVKNLRTSLDVEKQTKLFILRGLDMATAWQGSMQYNPETN